MLEWYNTAKLDRAAHDALINFIVGERRIGKTTHFMERILNDWYRDGSEAMWLRNKKVELVDPTFTAGFLTTAKLMGWCEEEFITAPDGVYTDRSKEEQVIHFQSISTASNRRGNATPNIKTMVFDEFMPEDRRYLKHAHKMLMSLTKTVLSGRTDARCYCLSNYISSANPYFVGFRIYPERKKDVTYFEDKGIAIEICRGYRTAIEPDNPWNKVYAAGGYQDYATAEEDSLFMLITRVPRGAEMLPHCILSNGIVYAASHSDGLIYWHEYKGPCRWLYAATLQETSNKVGLIPRWFMKDLKLWSENNLMRFTSPNTMFSILSIIYDAI